MGGKQADFTDSWWGAEELLKEQGQFGLTCTVGEDVPTFGPFEEFKKNVQFTSEDLRATATLLPDSRKQYDGTLPVSQVFTVRPQDEPKERIQPTSEDLGADATLLPESRKRCYGIASVFQEPAGGVTQG